MFISEALEMNCGSSYESVASLWLSNKKHTMIVNVVTSAALWGLWKLRNFLCFQNGMWKYIASVLWMIVGLIQNWKILCPAERVQELELRLEKLKYLAGQPGRLGS